MFKKRNTVAAIMAPINTAIADLESVSENRKALANHATDQAAVLADQAAEDRLEALIA